MARMACRIDLLRRASLSPLRDPKKGRVTTRACMAGAITPGELRSSPRSSPEVVQMPANPEPPALSLEDLAGEDPQMLRNVRSARRIVDSGVSVLIQGATGSGKEAFAHAMHAVSSRSTQPFVAVNCAAIPETLIESELFGYKPGAFTGARKEGMKGKILQSSGGTLFLDEIGDMPLSLQTRLLRVLEEQEIVPLGSETPLKVDLHVVAASHRNLREMIARGEFREDLYYRLNGITLELPRLADRADRERVIHRALSAETCNGRPAAIEVDALQRLIAYPWPGNIRELRNVIRTALAISEGGVVRLIDLPREIREPPASSAGAAPVAPVGGHAGARRSRTARDLRESVAGRRASSAAEGHREMPGQHDPRRRASRCQPQHAVSENEDTRNSDTERLDIDSSRVSGQRSVMDSFVTHAVTQRVSFAGGSHRNSTSATSSRAFQDWPGPCRKPSRARKCARRPDPRRPARAGDGAGHGKQSSVVPDQESPRNRSTGTGRMAERGNRVRAARAGAARGVIPLNESAAALLELCDGTRSFDEVVEQFVAQPGNAGLAADAEDFLEAAPSAGLGRRDLKKTGRLGRSASSQPPGDGGLLDLESRVARRRRFKGVPIEAFRCGSWFIACMCGQARSPPCGPTPTAVDDLDRLRTVADPTMSPDGQWVAYSVRSTDVARDKRLWHIWMTSWDGRQSMQVTQSPESEHSPGFSPDGRYPRVPLGSRGEGRPGCALAARPGGRRCAPGHPLQRGRDGLRLVARRHASWRSSCSTIPCPAARRPIRTRPRRRS